MNEWDKNHKMALRYRELYPPGTRIMLLSTVETLQPVPIGMRGTIKHIDDQAHFHMKWDNGRTLAVIPGADSFRKLTDKELAEEQGLVMLGDECQIKLPTEPVDCSELGFFDEMEDECWELVKGYCAKLGIEMQPNKDGEIPISYDVAKGIQDHILDTLQDAGVQMQFENQENDIDEDDNTPVMRM